MGAIEFAKNIQTTGKTIFSEKNTENTWFHFLLVFCRFFVCQPPGRFPRVQQKIKHTTQKQTTHTHTYKNNKNNIARRHQQTDQGRMMRSPCQKQCLTFQLYKSREDSGNQERKQSS